MSILKQIDWQMLSFIGVSLVNEYMINIYFPKVYYWNGQREYLRKFEQSNVDKDKKAA